MSHLIKSNILKIVSNLDRASFYKILRLFTKESFFIFDKTFSKQLDGVAMASPLDPTVANLFLCYHEKRWLDKCAEEFKPVLYRQYVDDICTLQKRRTA